MLRSRSRKEAVSVVQNIGYESGWSTKTAAGLRHAWKSLHDANFGARTAVTKFIILVTDGRAKDDVDAAAEELREQESFEILKINFIYFNVLLYFISMLNLGW